MKKPASKQGSQPVKPGESPGFPFPAGPPAESKGAPPKLTDPAPELFTGKVMKKDPVSSAPGGEVSPLLSPPSRRCSRRSRPRPTDDSCKS
jgi:hypothetical protein